MTITREQAWELLTEKLTNRNLIRHALAAEATMRALAERLGGDPDVWGVVGLLHDGDYEVTGEDLSRHALLMAEWLEEMGETDEEMLDAIRSHVYAHTGDHAPTSTMGWAMYTCDELTGFIVAVALVMPEKKLSGVSVEAVLKKFKKKDFAKAVNREQIALCEEKLGIPLPEFVEITIGAMQGISDDLGL